NHQGLESANPFRYSRRSITTVDIAALPQVLAWEAAGPWRPVTPTKVVEVRYNHFSDGRFRHGSTFLRVRPDKLPKDCLLDQLLQQTVIQDIGGFIEAGLAIAGRKSVPPAQNGYTSALPS